MTILETVYDEMSDFILTTSYASIPVYTGYASSETDPRSGVINILPLPSDYNNRTGVSYDKFQIDIWHENIFTVEALKHLVKLHFSELAKNVGFNVVYFIETDNGITVEQEDEIYHGILTLGIRYSLRG